MKLGGLLLAFALVSLGAAQPRPLEDFVLAGEKAYGMLPPDPVCGSVVSEIAWSEDGKYLIAVRADIGAAAAAIDFKSPTSAPAPSVEQSILCYDLLRRKTSVLWHGANNSTRIERVAWLKDSNSVVALISEDVVLNDGQYQRQTAVLMNAASGTTTVLASSNARDDGASEVRIEPCPTAPLALLLVSTLTAKPSTTGPPSWTAELRYSVVDNAGRMTDAKVVKQGFRFAGWSSDGKRPMIMDLKRGENGRSKPIYLALSLADGSEELLSDGIAYVQPPDPRLIHASVGDGIATTAKAHEQLRSAWLTSKSDESMALAAGDVSTAVLSPTLSGIAYVTQGVAMVRRIVEVPKEMFLQARKSAEKSAIMSRAKQAAVAAIMLASDSNDRMPSAQEDIRTLLLPYVKDGKLLDGFVYTFGGGFLTDVKDPANTEMGYIEGQGGRAVAYLDGHVKWRANP